MNKPERGYFGRRADAESSCADDSVKRVADGIERTGDRVVRETREMNSHEQELFDKAKKVVDSFVSQNFYETPPDIPGELVRINGEDLDALSGNRLIQLSGLDESSEASRLSFVNASIHEIIHFYSARRRYVGKESLIDQVGISTTNSMKNNSKWFEGLNEALVSSLHSRLFYDFVMSDKEIVSEPVRNKIYERRQEALSRIEDQPFARTLNEEEYPVLTEKGDAVLDPRYFSERLFLRMIVDHISQSKNKPFKDVQNQFDRVAFYGWDEETKKDLIQVVGPDVWRALAWMKPGDFKFTKLDSDYFKLFTEVEGWNYEEAQQTAQKIVEGKRADLQYPNASWGAHSAKDWQDEDIYGDDMEDFPLE